MDGISTRTTPRATYFIQTCLDDMIPEDNSVRLIDQFVNLLDLDVLGFQSKANQGRPPYNPTDLLKLYIYGYMN